MMKKEFAPVTPGEMLKEEFLAEYGLVATVANDAVVRRALETAGVEFIEEAPVFCLGKGA